VSGIKKEVIVKLHLLALAVILTLVLPSCTKEVWKPGIPLAKEKVTVGVLHITDPFSEGSGYAYAHQRGIDEMKQKLGLGEGQVLYKINVDDVDTLHIESSIRDLIAEGANIIVATSWGYMEVCEKLAKEYSSVVFAHATGYKYNDTNFTNYFGRVYQARYLSGIVAGLKTNSNKIGYVAAWGTENSEVSQGINAFARGVEKVNPQAKVYVRIIYSWFDPMGETTAARALIGAGCDIIAQHCDTSNPQIEAERAGVMGIGYNTDMSVEAPGVVLTSVLWNWGVYYTALVQSVIDGTFTTAPYFGSLKDGMVGLSPLNENIVYEPEILQILDEERRRLESSSLAGDTDFDVFLGVMETNDGRRIGREGENLSDETIRNGIDWHYRNVVTVK
jgi:basic membrane protein A